MPEKIKKMQLTVGRILVTGAGGRLGTHLVGALREKHGPATVIATELPGLSGNYRPLDVLDRENLFNLIRKEKISTVYHLAGCLPAEAEKDVTTAYQLNVGALINILDAARDFKLKVFWPGSIAVFGHESPKTVCPQDAPKRPDTVYGICKSAAEGWCSFYREVYRVDVRAIRYPAIISPLAVPRGGTLDYVGEVFTAALHTRAYTCYLKPHTRVPVIYAEDAVRAAMKLMAADRKRLSVRDAYNLSGTGFSPREVQQAIQAILPSFTMHYRPDARQQQAERWPISLDDSLARQDWGWQPEYDLQALVQAMLSDKGKIMNSNGHAGSLLGQEN